MCVDNVKGNAPKKYNQHDLAAKRNEWHFTPPAPVTSYLKSIIKVRTGFRGAVVAARATRSSR